MPRSWFESVVGAVLLLVATFGLTACGTRVITTTGTTLGLKASPGDGQTRPPQVTFGYKRAEASIIPTKGTGATKEKNDAYSTLSTFYFNSRWFGDTHIASFIGTGFAARDIVDDGTSFKQAFANATVRTIETSLQNRRKQLVDQVDLLTNDQMKRALDILAAPVPPGQTPQQALKGLIGDAQNEAQIARIGDAFNQVR
jgi:hypothetical protein